MLSTRSTLRTATGIAALSLALPAAAQDADLPALPELPSVEGVASEAPVATQVWIEKEVMTTAEIDQLPAEYRNLPVGEEISTTTVNEDGVETITRTRRIVSRSPVETDYQATAEQVELSAHGDRRGGHARQRALRSGRGLPVPGGRPRARVHARRGAP